MMFVPHRKHTYGLPRSVTGIVLLSAYVNNVHTSQEAHMSVSTACYVERFTFLLHVSRLEDLWESTDLITRSLYLWEINTKLRAPSVLAPVKERHVDWKCDWVGYLSSMKWLTEETLQNRNVPDDGVWLTESLGFWAIGFLSYCISELLGFWASSVIRNWKY
jgi:hypothetical protein